MQLSVWSPSPLIMESGKMSLPAGRGVWAGSGEVLPPRGPLGQQRVQPGRGSGGRWGGLSPKAGGQRAPARCPCNIVLGTIPFKEFSAFSPTSFLAKQKQNLSCDHFNHPVCFSARFYTVAS